MVYLQKIIESIREIRNQMKIPPSKFIDVMIKCNSEKSEILLNENILFVSQLTRSGNIKIGKDISKPEGSSSSVVGGDEIYVPLKDLIDLDKEKERLEKEIKRVGDMINSLKAKLNNENFIKRAPNDVIDKEKDKLQNFEFMLSKLNTNYNELK
jgi:valyl-tRNA synthetase